MPEGNNTDDIESALTEFFDAFRRSRARLHRDPNLARLSLSEFSLLRAVDDSGDLGVSSVAKKANMAQPPASRGIDRLIAKGLVDVGPHPTDGRVRAISLTDAGSILLADHRARVERTAQLIRERLGVKAATVAPSILRLIAVALEEVTE